MKFDGNGRRKVTKIGSFRTCSSQVVTGHNGAFSSFDLQGAAYKPARKSVIPRSNVRSASIECPSVEIVSCVSVWAWAWVLDE